MIKRIAALWLSLTLILSSIVIVVEIPLKVGAIIRVRNRKVDK